MSGKKYTYAGNRDSNNTAEAVTYHPPVDEGEEKKYQGEIRPGFGDIPVVLVGEKLTLSAPERNRLGEVLILTDSDGDDVTDDLPKSPSTEAVAANPSGVPTTDETSTDTGNLQGKNSSSKTRTN